MICFHTSTMPAPSSRALVFCTSEWSRCEGPMVMWTDLIFFSRNRKDSKTVVKHGDPAVLGGVTQEQDRLLAGWQSTHCTTTTICSGRFSSSPRGPRFDTEQGAPRRMSNIKIECQLGLKSCKNDNLTSNPALK